jgi:cytochrome b involved in lipid metabolism
MALGDKVYDLGSFAREHPGGTAILLAFRGKNATEKFNEFHSPSILENLPSSVQVIGNFRTQARPPEAAAAKAQSAPAAASLWSVVNNADFIPLA